MIKNYLVKESCRQRNILKVSTQGRWVDLLGQMASQSLLEQHVNILTFISELVIF